MKVSPLPTVAACLWLAACGQQIAVQAPETVDLSSEAVHLSGDGPPSGPDGTCWAHDLIPAVFETVTEQTQVVAEVRDAAGIVITPASYKTVAKVRVLSERRDIWFTAPCALSVTVDFIATLQRALKARGYYEAAVTGVMDGATTEAVRRFQADHGLDSPMLSLAATRQLGIVTTDLYTQK